MSGFVRHGASTRAVLLALAALIAASAPAWAQDATWLGFGAPTADEWNQLNNWSTGVLPTGTATFANNGAPTNLSIRATGAGTNVTLGALQFTAPAYTIHVGDGLTLTTLTLTGAGIIGNSSNAPTIIATFGGLNFLNASSAGSATLNNAAVLSFFGASTAGSSAINNDSGLSFSDASTAGSATVTNNGLMQFQNTSTAGAAAVTNNHLLIFNDASTAGSANIINTRTMEFFDTSTAGSASITNTSSNGVVFFVGASTAGNATINNNHNVAFADSSTAGGATIANNGSLFFNNNSSAGNAGITSSGYVNFYNTSTASSTSITSSGSVNFYNTSTASSASITNSGSLSFNNNSTAGAAAITNTGSMTFNDLGTAGNAAIANNGTLNFIATSMAGNAVITNNNIINFINSSTAASAAINNNNGLLEFWNTSTAGNATIAGAGHMYFRSNSTAGNASITTNNSLEFLDASTAGSAAITNNNSILFFTSSTAANAVITNNGRVSFFDNTTAGQARLINNALGIVDFSVSTGSAGNQSITAGSIEGAGNFYFGANALSVGNNLNTTVSGVISDCGPTGVECFAHSLSSSSTGGALVKTGTGTLILTGNNTYTGGTTISAGTLQLGNGGTTGSILGDVLDNATLAFNRSNAYQFDGAISGTGGVQQNGTGTTILTAANTYGGGTTISAGTLQLGNGGTTGSIQGNVLDNATLAFNRSNAYQFDGAISGTGGVQQNGTGTTILTAANTYGGGTTISAGTLQLGNGGTTGSIVGDVLNNATFNIVNADTTGISSITNNGTTALFNGTSAGSASITNNTGGALQFFNTSTAGSATITNNGALDFFNTSTAGHATITNDSGVRFNNASTAGSAAITNNFFMAFFDTSTAGAATITNNKFLDFSNASTAGTATIANSSTLNFNNTSTAGSAVITNSNMLTFGNTSTAGAATINNGRQLDFRDASTAGSATINNNVGGSLTFYNTSGAGNAVITNNFGMAFRNAATAGAAAITNNNTLRFLYFSTAGGATITNNNSMTFENASTAESATITNNALLSFFDTSTGGLARLIVNTPGVLDFSSSSGPNNDHKLSAGSIEGAGNVYLGSNELTVGGNNLSAVVSGVISDCGTGAQCFAGAASGGALVKTGTGTLTLSGIDTYSGATTVNGGTLSVNGSIASSSLTTVNAGGTLGGNGTVGNTLINGGALAPGNSVGTLTVQGSLTFAAASSYLVEVSPVGADRTNVTGLASVAGTVVVTVAPGTFVAKQYTILKATGGVAGKFDTVVSQMPGILASLSYDPNDVFLNFSLALSHYSSLNGNQQRVADALTNFFDITRGIPLVFATLTPAGLAQVSGETAAGSQQTTFDAMGQFMGMLFDTSLGNRGGIAGPGGAIGFAPENGADPGSATMSAYVQGSKSERDAYAAVYSKAPPRLDPFANRWSVWAAGYGGSQTTDGNAVAGSNTATSRVFGTAVGADYRLTPDTLARFALAGGETNFSVANGGTGRSDLFQAGAYVRHNIAAAYLSGALAYGWQDITTDRTVTIAGVDRLRARFNANAFSGRVEGGWRFVTPWMGLTPYAAGQFTTFDLPAYAEQVLAGANTFALSYASKSVTASRSELGLRADRSWALTEAILTLHGRAAWAHDFNPDRSIAATFQTLPGASFVANGAVRAHDAVLTTASAEWKWLSGFSLASTFEGEFSDVTRSYAGKGVLRYEW